MARKKIDEDVPTGLSGGTSGEQDDGSGESGIVFNGQYWGTPDGRRFNTRLKAEKHVSGNKD
jgi:hypothetical protein